MRRVFLTTVKRGAKKKITGFLYELDWKRGKAKKIVPIPEPTIKDGFWNPRGGNRGGRGIRVFRNIMYVATATTIRKYDTNLQYLGSIQNSKFKGLHDIIVDSTGIIASSTSYDLIIKVDFTGKTLWQKRFHHKRLLADTLHLNNLCKIGNTLYFLSNKKKSVFKVVGNNKQQIIFDDDLKTPHDIVKTSPSHIMVNNTSRQALHIYSLRTGALVKTIHTKVYGKGSKGSKHFATSGWQRGLVHFFKNIYLVGTSPLTVFSVNIKNGKVGKLVQLDKNVAHCTYSLCVTNTF